MSSADASGGGDDSLLDKLETFLSRYYDDRDGGRNAIATLAQRYPKEQTSLTVDYADLFQYDTEIAEDLLDNPDAVMSALETALQEYDLPTGETLSRARVEVVGLPEDVVYDVGDYTTGNEDGLLGIQGQVNKVAQSKGNLTEIVYECQRCGITTTIPQPPGSDRQQPHECQACERQGPFRIDFDASETEDYQLVRVQRPPERASNGAESDSIDVTLTGDLVNEVSPGDRVVMTAELRRELDSDDATTYSHFAAANAVNQKETDFEDLDFSQYEAEIEDLANSANPLQQIVDSLKPSHKGDAHIKEAIALQMFGGVKKELPDGSTKRAQSHILLVGDPGTDKSGLLEYAVDLSPRSVYTSGKNATSAGLTCAAVQSDFGDGGWTLEAGALVQAHRGLCAIDEFDKMDDEDRSGVQEALAQGHISPSKAGITNVQLPAETTVLAAANPKYGRFDSYEPIGDQIELDPTLISRFDLIFTVQDKPDRDADADLADHLNNVAEVGQRRAAGEQVGEASAASPAIDPDVLRHYIAYAKQNVTPILSEDAKEVYKDFYVGMRVEGADEDSPVPVTARSLEALHRLGEAKARTRLSDTITAEDAEFVVSLVERSLNDVGVDPESGEYDADIVETGMSKDQREKIQTVLDTVEEIEMQNEMGAPIGEVMQALTEDGFSQSQRENLIRKAKNEGKLYEPSDDHLRRT